VIFTLYSAVAESRKIDEDEWLLPLKQPFLKHISPKDKTLAFIRIVMNNPVGKAVSEKGQL